MSKNILQQLADCGVNPFAVTLVCESLLKHPKPEKVTFMFPNHRPDCPGWLGVEVTLTPIKVAEAAGGE